MEAATSTAAFAPARRVAGGTRRALDWAIRSVELRWALAVVFASIAAMVLTLSLWNADLTVPFVYQGDGQFYQMSIKGILEHGWWFSNPSLGAPFGQQLYYFPLSDTNLYLLVIKLMGVFTSNSAVIGNLFYLVTFPLDALAAYLVLRKLKV